MNKIIVANWKMNVLPSVSVEYINKLEKLNLENSLIVLAPYIDLPYLRSEKILFGAQNVYYKNKGAYTGEISPLMLKDININYVLLGHNERRKLFNENDSLINLKIRNCITNDMNIILCVDSIDTLKKDIEGISDCSNIIIAYEPTDYIGGFKVAKEDMIKEFINEAKKITNGSKVIYGGGINLKNIITIKNINELDGIMIGNSSIEINSFTELISIY